MTISYNPNQTTSTWNGLDFSTGLKADSSIVATPSADVSSYEAGLKTGEGVTTVMTDTSGTIEINTLYGSKVGQQLAAMYKAQRTNGGNPIYGRWETKNPNDTIALVGKNAHIQSRTAITHGANAENQGYKWVFKCTELDTDPAGSDAIDVANRVASTLSTLSSI